MARRNKEMGVRVVLPYGSGYAAVGPDRTSVDFPGCGVTNKVSQDGDLEIVQRVKGQDYGPVRAFFPKGQWSYYECLPV